MALIPLIGFNWYILHEALRVIAGVFGITLLEQRSITGTVSFLIVIGLAFIFHSPLGESFLRLISGGRRAIEREHAKIDPIIKRVQNAIKIAHGYEPISLRLMVVDDSAPNAFAIGKETLILSRGLYESATDEELAGVIAHEMGHLHNGDSNKLGIALGVSSVSLVVAWVATFFLIITNAVSRGASASGGGQTGMLISLMAFFFVILSWMFIGMVKVGNWMLKLAMLFIGRKQEYLADQFAIKAGFGPGLLSVLERTKDFEWTSEKSFLSRLYATHPPTMLRIGEMEKMMGPYTPAEKMAA